MGETAKQQASQREEGVNSAINWTNKMFEAWGVYTDASLQATRQLTDFAANAAKETVSLYAELQAANVEALQEGQACVMKYVSVTPEKVKDPKDAYQQVMQEFGGSAEKLNKLVQSNTHAVMRSTEQYWLSAQQAGNGIQDTYTQAYEKLTKLYTQV